MGGRGALFRNLGLPEDLHMIRFFSSLPASLPVNRKGRRKEQGRKWIGRLKRLRRRWRKRVRK